MDHKLKERIEIALQNEEKTSVVWTDRFNKQRHAFIEKFDERFHHQQLLVNDLNEGLLFAVTFDDDDDNTRGKDFEIPNSLVFDDGVEFVLDHVELNISKKEGLLYIPSNTRVLMNEQGYENEKIQGLDVKYIEVSIDNPVFQSTDDALYVNEGKDKSLIWISPYSGGTLQILEGTTCIKPFVVCCNYDRWIIPASVKSFEYYATNSIDLTLKFEGDVLLSHDYMAPVKFVTGIVIGRKGGIITRFGKSYSEVLKGYPDLEWISVEEGNKNFYTRNGELFDAEDNHVIWSSPNSGLPHIRRVITKYVENFPSINKPLELYIEDCFSARIHGDSYCPEGDIANDLKTSFPNIATLPYFPYRNSNMEEDPSMQKKIEWLEKTFFSQRDLSIVSSKDILFVGDDDDYLEGRNAASVDYAYAYGLCQNTCKPVVLFVWQTPESKIQNTAGYFIEEWDLED